MKTSSPIESPTHPITIRRFSRYEPLTLSHAWKKKLGCVSTTPVVVAGRPVIIKGEWVHHHNLYHLEISYLDRILMGRDWVSGIHGFYSSMYHDVEIQAEYNGFLDEARVAVHESLIHPSIYTFIKLLRWSLWFIRHGMNPIAIVYRHWKSLQRYDVDQIMIQKEEGKVFALSYSEKALILPEGYEASMK